MKARKDAENKRQNTKLEIVCKKSMQKSCGWNCRENIEHWKGLIVATLPKFDPQPHPTRDL